MIYSVTGRVWNSETRKHDKLQTVEFERRVDAAGFMNLNQDWILGMVMDRDAEAIAADKAEAAKLAEIENGWKDADGNSLLTDETDDSGIPS